MVTVMTLMMVAVTIATELPPRLSCRAGILRLRVLLIGTDSVRILRLRERTVGGRVPGCRSRLVRCTRDRIDRIPGRGRQHSREPEPPEYEQRGDAGSTDDGDVSPNRHSNLPGGIGFRSVCRRFVQNTSRTR